MTLHEDVERLRNIPLFAKIEPSKLKLLAFAAERVTYEPGETLFQKGDTGDAAYIIVDGTAEVEVPSPSGPITVARLERNDIVGEIAILCDVPRTATVRAAERLTTLKISKELFFRLVCQFPQISVEVMRELARRLERTTRQLQEAMDGPAGP